MNGYVEGRYSLEYKCRRCGCIFTRNHTDWLQEESVEPVMFSEIAKNCKTIHECSFFKYGIADFCGFTLDDR